MKNLLIKVLCMTAISACNRSPYSAFQHHIPNTVEKGEMKAQLGASVFDNTEGSLDFQAAYGLSNHWFIATGGHSSSSADIPIFSGAYDSYSNLHYGEVAGGYGAWISPKIRYQALAGWGVGRFNFRYVYDETSRTDKGGAFYLRPQIAQTVSFVGKYLDIGASGKASYINYGRFRFTDTNGYYDSELRAVQANSDLFSFEYAAMARAKLPNTIMLQVQAGRQLLGKNIQTESPISSWFLSLSLGAHFNAETVFGKKK